MMKKLISTLIIAVISSSANAAIQAVPEIDGALTIQVLALISGLGLLLKKKV